ncbi:MAG: T9SS type A sorting domain-containing protein [Chitinophagales bacterium]|nr:T9SS type A sorting domain-containing protein [Chitinophagales bacterium]
MKKILFSIVFVLVSFASMAQWSLIKGGNQGPELRCPYFVNGKVGWVVGGIAGTKSSVYKTVDAGKNWTIQTATFTGVIRAIHAIDANTAVACGEFGNIMKTTNGGTTWLAKTSGTGNLLRSIYFTNSTTGYAAGGLGTILKTTDAGETWSALSSGITQDLINIRFGSENVGYAVSSSSSFSNGIILKTADAGATWTQVYTNTQGLLSVAVLNDKTILAGGGDNLGTPYSHSYIVKSTDGGTTWAEVFAGINYRTMRAGEYNTEQSAWFLGDAGYIVGTADGGTTWSELTVKNGYLGINFANADSGYGCGIAGLIIRYNNVLRIGQDDPASFNVYPNPMVTGATISLTTNAADNSSLVIADMQGKIVRTVSFNGERNVTIDRGDLASGIYVIDLITEDQLVERQKLVVQ